MTEEYISEFILKKSNDAASQYIRKKYDERYKLFEKSFINANSKELKNMTIAYLSGFLDADVITGNISPEEEKRLFEIILLYAGIK